MKFHQVLLGATILLAACSSPKQVYHFDHYDYNSGKKMEERIFQDNEELSPLTIGEESIVASAENRIILTKEKKLKTPSSSVNAVVEEYKSMSKSDRKAFRSALKKEVKSYLKKEKDPKSVDSIGETKVFDATVALAILFGGAGIVLTVLASVSNVFWILGAISIVIGAYFFIQWVANGNG